MSDKERTGIRDMTYSRWHRMDRLKRYLDSRRAWECGMIDIDTCEYCRYCYTPLALIETQVSTAAPKRAPVTAYLAVLAKIEAYSVSIVVGDIDDIAFFRVRRLEPPSDVIEVLPPSRYAELLHSLRVAHTSACTGRG